MSCNSPPVQTKEHVWCTAPSLDSTSQNYGSVTLSNRPHTCESWWSQQPGCLTVGVMNCIPKHIFWLASGAPLAWFGIGNRWHSCVYLPWCDTVKQHLLHFSSLVLDIITSHAWQELSCVYSILQSLLTGTLRQLDKESGLRRSDRNNSLHMSANATWQANAGANGCAIKTGKCFQCWLDSPSIQESHLQSYLNSVHKATDRDTLCSSPSSMYMAVSTDFSSSM